MKDDSTWNMDEQTSFDEPVTPRGAGGRKVRSLLGAFAAGAAIMYFLDPDRGRRRRALARDKVVHGGKVAIDAVGRTTRDMRNRAVGKTAAVRSRLSKRNTQDDLVVSERIRARLGRVVSNPAAIDVFVESGTVTLSGDVLRDEAGKLVSEVRRVRGVAEVDDQLTVHESAVGVPSLQNSVGLTGSGSKLSEDSATLGF